jgi:hypothetical protein
MPELLHKAHEMFALFVANGNNVLAAAVAAGYPRDLEMAELLEKQPRIKNRIEELRPLFSKRNKNK